MFHSGYKARPLPLPANLIGIWKRSDLYQNTSAFKRGMQNGTGKEPASEIPAVLSITWRIHDLIQTEKTNGLISKRKRIRQRSARRHTKRTRSLKGSRCINEM